MYTNPPGNSAIFARRNTFGLVEAACHGEYLGVAECGELALCDIRCDVRVAIQRWQNMCAHGSVSSASSSRPRCTRSSARSRS